MVECELLEQLVKRWNKDAVINRKFDMVLYESIYDDLEIIKAYDKMLLPIKSTTNFIVNLWKYTGNIVHFLYVLDVLYKDTKYLFKSNKMNQDTIYCDFNAKNNLIKQCHDIVLLMLQINQTLPMRMDVSDSIKKAFMILNRFEKHGHYLPNLSKNNNEHNIRDVLLYLKLSYKYGVKIYKLAIDPVERKVDFDSLESDDKEEDNKDFKL